MRYRIVKTAAFFVLLGGVSTPAPAQNSDSKSYANETRKSAPRSVAKLPAIAVGSIRGADQHLSRPREEVVQRRLSERVMLAPQMETERKREVIRTYYAGFAKKTPHLDFAADRVLGQAAGNGISFRGRARDLQEHTAPFGAHPRSGHGFRRPRHHYSLGAEIGRRMRNQDPYYFRSAQRQYSPARFQGQ